MELEVTIVIDRPVSLVWDFYAVHHVENHPRWDPDIELENATEGPIGVATVIRRRSTRFETPGEFPGVDDSMKEFIRPLMERSAANIKALIEAET